MEKATSRVLRLPRPLAQKECFLLRVRYRRELVQPRSMLAGRPGQVPRKLNLHRLLLIISTTY